ncbi:Pyridoxal 5'-phosphate synthase subunit snz1, partial [Coemansia nantahalensis]
MEAKVMEACGVALIDEDEQLTGKSGVFIKKYEHGAPFICGISNLEEALKRIAEGAAMLRNMHGGSGSNTFTGHYQTIQDEIKALAAKTDDERKEYATKNNVPLGLVNQVVQLKRLPVPFFADADIVLPVDVAMAMDIGYDGVIVSAGAFTVANPERRMRSLVMAAIHYKNPRRIAAISEDCTSKD